MKIARTLTVSGRHVEWYAPSPAPSLRELARPKGVTEGVYPDERNPPFVGAMKIARNVAASGRYVEWYAPLPAPSLRELLSECEAEGVYPDERKRSKITEFIMAGG